MADRGQEAREEDRERLRLHLDAFKHISTLNVAALVLFLALIRDFSPKGGFASDVPTLTLLTFGISLVSSLVGLLAATTSTRRQSPLRPSLSTVILLYFCGTTFAAGMCIAVFVIGTSALAE